MRYLLIILVVCLSPAFAETIAITGGKIYTVSGDKIENGIVIIDKGKITAVGANVAIPNGARIINASGKHVTPGIMSSNSIFGLSESGSGRFPNDHSANGSGFTAAFDVKYALNNASLVIREGRRQGLTRAVSAPTSSGDIFSGSSAIITMDNTLDMHFADGPMFAKFDNGGNRSISWVRIRGIFDQVKNYAQNKSRVLRGQSQDYLLSIADMEALIPVMNGNKKLALELGSEAEIRGAIALKADYGIDLILIGGQEAWKVAKELAAAKISVMIDPEQNIFDNVTIAGTTFSNAARLEAAGVKFSFYHGGMGSLNAANYIIQFAGIAVAHGMTHDGAIRALTLSPAEMFGIDKVYGSIDVGKDADIVVWDGDPLEVTSNTDHVIVRGVEYELTSRRTMLRDRYLKLKK
jgi:imidazolonepropionase-like amidohydrolase